LDNRDAGHCPAFFAATWERGFANADLRVLVETVVGQFLQNVMTRPTTEACLSIESRFQLGTHVVSGALFSFPSRRRYKGFRSYRRCSLGNDIVTFREMGLPSLSFSNWYGLLAPKGTPRGVIDMLNAAVVEALETPAMRSRLNDFGMEVIPRVRQTPEALGALVKADAEEW
jgi:hypothetical protein